MVRRNFNLIPVFIANFRRSLANEMEEAVEDAHDEMIDGWEQGRTATGKTWQPLAPETVQRKGHGDPLIESGEMMDSAGWTSRDNLTFEIYISDPKIGAHEFGLEHVPRRPVLGPAGEYLIDNVDEDIGDAIDMSFAGSGGATAGMALIGGM